MELDGSQATIKKQQNDAAWKKKFNQFEGIVHEDNGILRNFGDGMPVGGVNKHYTFAEDNDMKYPAEKPKIPIGNSEVADKNFDRV